MILPFARRIVQCIFLSFDFQSNSDTYAVINLPGEEDEEIDGGGGGGGGTVSLPPAPLSSEDAHEKVHHYSKIDKSKKRRPPDPPPGHSAGHGVNIRPHSLVPQPPIPTMQQHPQLQVIGRAAYSDLNPRDGPLSLHK